MAEITELAYNVKPLPVEKRYSVEGEMAERIRELIHSFDGRTSLVAAIGVIDLIKHELIESARNST